MPPLIHDGSGRASPERLLLRAGPLHMLYEAGALRYLHLGGAEVLRGIYAVVRDENWGTIPATLHEETHRIGDESFEIAFLSDHGCFQWRGTISGSADGTLRFTFDGEVSSAFRRNRVGFCVLHPMDLAGKPCLIEHTDGRAESSAFPQQIAPHQPFFDVRAITHEIAAGVRAEVRMEGDAFETEDQRNWTDASFKTYCTPLSLPFPVAIERGTRIQQTVTLRLIGWRPSITFNDHAPILDIARPADGVSITLDIDPDSAIPLPPIGLCCASDGAALTALEIERLRALHPAHLRLDFSPENAEARLEAGWEQARALGCPLELAVHVGAEFERDLSRVRATVDALHADVVRWLVFAQGESVTPSSVIEAAHRVLPSVGAGTDANFTELNRQRPTTALDWLVYSINPQVHAFDNASLVETLPVQTVTLACARTFAGGARLAVSPVTFKMRVNPAATSPETDTLASRVDARQMSLFGAGWTLGSLRALAEGRAHSVTFYETTGALGVMERAGDSVYPLYHVLADAGEFAGGDVLRVTSSHPLLSDGLALRREGRLRVLIANYTDQTRRVRVRGLNGRFLHKSLDENSAVYAMTDPQGFRADTGTPVETVGGELLLDLFPYAVVRLDALSSTEDETL